MESLVLHALVAGFIAATVAKTKIFARFRNLFFRVDFLWDLFQCPYCLCPWLCIPMFYICDGVNYLNFFILTGLSCLWAGLFCLSMKIMED